jgi:hypothetical protein
MLRRVGVRGRWVTAALLLALSAPAAAHGANPPRSCAWVLEPTYDRENVLFPEVTTRYLAGVVPVPPGGYVEIKGRFPHARYMSLQTYSTTLQSLSVLRDEKIVADNGSTNPFVPGADRTATKRDYTVRLVSGKPPAGGGPPNTLYDTNPDGSQNGRGLAYRIYLADKGTDTFGDAPAPRISLHLASGTAIPVPECPDLVPDTSALSNLLAQLGSDQQVPLPGLLAHREPAFHRFVNAPTSYALAVSDNQYLDSLTPALEAITTQLPSGLGENADNKYVAAYLSQEFGPVLALRAKLPRTPKTFNGEATMGGGQMRFWSMCTGVLTTQTFGCVVDKDVPVDSKRRYTVVISTAAARPRNATAKCGVAWLPWGPVPKGIAVMRNMLPASTFTHAVQNAKRGEEKTTLGAYYPVGTYSSKAAFEKRGCRA